MATPSNPTILVTGPAAFYGEYPFFAPGKDLLLGALFTNFTQWAWDETANVLITAPNTAVPQNGANYLSSRDTRDASNFFDGTNWTLAALNPGDTYPLQYQINGGALRQGGASGPVPTAVLGFRDYQSLYVVAQVAGAAVVTIMSLVSNGVTSEVIYSKAGATDYYWDYGGNWWYKIGGAWNCDTVADASIIAAFNAWFGVLVSGTPIPVVTEGTFLVYGFTSSGDTNYHLVQNGVTTNFAPLAVAVGGTPFYGQGRMTINSERNFRTTQLNFDGATYASLKTSTVDYGIGGAAPPPPPEWTPPTPVPPYVPPNPGRVIPAKNFSSFSLTNIAHETTGNY